jgi:hypothetical protein
MTTTTTTAAATTASSSPTSFLSFSGIGQQNGR